MVIFVEGDRGIPHIPAFSLSADLQPARVSELDPPRARQHAPSDAGAEELVQGGAFAGQSLTTRCDDHLSGRLFCPPARPSHVSLLAQVNEKLIRYHSRHFKITEMTYVSAARRAA